MLHILKHQNYHLTESDHPLWTPWIKQIGGVSEVGAADFGTISPIIFEVLRSMVEGERSHATWLRSFRSTLEYVGISILWGCVYISEDNYM